MKQVHSQMAASAWLATSEHEGKVYGLQEELRRQHGSPCLPLLEKALQHGQQAEPAGPCRAGSILQELAWEKLHIGNWKDVQMVWRDLYSLGCLLVASGKLAPSLPPPAASSLPARDKATALHGALRGGQCADVTCLEAGTDSPEIVDPARCGPAAAEEPAAVSAGVSTADFSSEAAEQPAAVNAGMGMAHFNPETAEGPAASAQGQAHAPLAAVTCQEPAAAAATAAGEQAGGCSAAPRAPQLGAADCPAAAPLGCSAAEAAASALHDLDLAAIMGGPLFRPEVDAAIASVQALLQQRHEPADRRAEQQAAAPGQAASTAPLSEPACGTAASSDAAASKAGSGTAAANLVPAAGAGVAAADTAAAGSRCHAQSGCLGRGPAGGSRRSAQAPAPGTPTGKRHKAAAGASAGSKSFHRAGVTLPPGSLGPEGVRPPVERLPSLERFLVTYMCAPKGGQPAVITDLLRDWPALERWQDLDYLFRVAGLRTVPVEVGRHYMAEGWGQRLMTLSDFIKLHIHQQQKQQQGSHPAGEVQGGAQHPTAAVGPALRAGVPASDALAAGESEPPGSSSPMPQVGYLAQHPLFEQIPALAGDIREPQYCALGEGDVRSVNAWFGPPGTITPLHHDPHHNLLAQVVGTKYVRLYHPRYTQQVRPNAEGLTTNTSQIDLEAASSEETAVLASLQHVDCLLLPGQTLYIPPGWWHFVKAVTVSFSVSFWWQ